uniref:hypothetical protein n=1 Tax=Bacteroides nordii TaxID=291645 RepID=UPI002A82A68E
VNFYYNYNGSVLVIKVGQRTFIIVGQVTLYFPLNDHMINDDYFVTIEKLAISYSCFICNVL